MLTGISGRTKVCGVFGCPIEHSFSPAMHNAAFSALDLDFVYVPFPVEPGNLPAAVEAVKSLGLAGVNVTVPHKQAVLSLLDEITGEARLIGAVNTIVNNSGRLIGDNTDGRGFLRALKEKAGFTPAAKKILILGAGGAARAVAVQSALAGARKVFLSNRSKNRAEVLADLVTMKSGVEVEVVPWPGCGEEPDLAEALYCADLVVQTTPVGMYPNEGSTIQLPYTLFRPGQVACDLVYNPVETLFLKSASQAGATVVDGLGMLLYQGVLAFELWTGASAPVDIMRKALANAVINKGNSF
ncbi:MAG: Shikimate dehydrogenase [Pelotomaculum sp. PtaU1.Bin035]|nr:MAG: Shikimate dehydrogenase [Pelotomaculum sp. PtaU1.Bin035]